MLTRQTTAVELCLTPLTPIHIGCGIDLEPTQYVVGEDKLIYHFDPARLPLETEQRQALLRAINHPSAEVVRMVQRFFAHHAPLCQSFAHQLIFAAPGVVEQYHRSIGREVQGGNGPRGVHNQLFIERNAHHPHTGLAYLPGSSLKGAMRTAWLNKLNGGRDAQQHPTRDAKEDGAALEQRLLQGRFNTDPFRLLSVGDAQGNTVASEVMFCVNRHKTPVLKDGQVMTARGPSTRREVILPAQWRCLKSLMTLEPLRDHLDPGTPPAKTRLSDWAALAQACQKYYLPRLEDELNLLETSGWAKADWIAGLRGLLRELAPAFQAHQALLLRVGRHSGAEDLTLDGARRIRIRGPKGASYIGRPTTLWLAASHETSMSNMLPLGWVLVQRADAPLPAVQTWCERWARPDLGHAQARLSAARQQAQALAQAHAQARAKREQQAAAQAQAQEDERRRIASLSEQGQAVEALRQQLLAHTAARKQNVGGQLYQDTRKLMQQAPSWPPADQAALAHLLRTLVPEKIELGGKAKEVKQAAQQLAAADPTGSPP
jgi:CRISPR-associated protein Csm5